MKPAEGVILGGRYRLVRQIAVGGMGEVWVAHDDALARDIAVKVLREEFAGDPGFLERFRTEARNSASLSHPNIAQLYDYGEQDGSGFLVMELVVGEPMSDLLDREPVLPPRRMLPILAQTARALHAAHLAGVVHRDVKPGNILLGRAGRVKITDFGVSLAVNQVPMTATGMVMGTAQYLSPEQAVGRAATGASDIYSLGIIAYECLVGHRPFTGPTAVDIAVAHVNTPVPPLPPSVDKPLADLVMRMLAKEPADRPRSAASLARTLDGMVEQTPPSGVPVVGPPLVIAGRTAPEAVTAVPGSAVPDAAGGLATSPGTARAGTAPGAGGLLEHPPSYPPRRELREAGGDRADGTRSIRTVPRRTSTTTGTRIGRLTWPLVALLLLLVALLGAALADRLFGAAATSGGAERPAATVLATAPDPGRVAAGGGSGYAFHPPVPVG